LKLTKRFAMTLLMVLALTLLVVPLVKAGGCISMCEPPAPPTPTYVPIDMDQSVQFNDSDVGVVLSKVEDEAGNLQMDVYTLKNNAANGGYLFTITQDDLAPYATEHPAKNMLLASADGVSVYMLTTGEIQINAGPDFEGKTHVKILNGIPWTTVYGYTIDPQ
jgi:hypothetical protein